jgi:serine/threonine protein kinase
VSDAAAALASLHGAWVSHGDVKPDNILIGDDGRIRMADPIGCGWGCTVLFKENQGGTPGYWAPEIAAGSTISYEGDAWSFGATIHQLATGTQPRDGTPFDMRYPIFSEAPELAEVVNACCQFQPNLRAKMIDIPRLLRGEKWSSVYSQRQRANGILLGVGALGLLALARK